MLMFEEMLKSVIGSVILGTFFWYGVAMCAATIADKAFTLYDELKQLYKDYKAMQRRKNRLYSEYKAGKVKRG